MNWEYAREAIMLAETLNFSKAADRLFITQSTLSKHISTIEREIGFRIFSRTTSHVELTEHGKIYLESLRRVTDIYDETLAGLKASKEVDSSVRLSGPLLFDQFLSLLVTVRSSLTIQGVDLDISLSDTGLLDVVEDLLHNRCDLAISFDYDDSENALVSEHLCDIPFGIACRPGHALLSKNLVTFEDLLGEKLIMHPQEGRERFHALAEKTLTKHGVKPEIAFMSEGTIGLPEEEMGIVFGVYYLGTIRVGGEMIARQIDDLEDVFHAQVIRRRNESNPHVLRLFDCIVDNARKSLSSSEQADRTSD